MITVRIYIQDTLQRILIYGFSRHPLKATNTEIFSKSSTVEVVEVGESREGSARGVHLWLLMFGEKAFLEELVLQALLEDTIQISVNL